MKIRVEADGSQNGTKIVDAETGQRLHGITSLSFFQEAPNAPKVFVEAISWRASIQGDADVLMSDPRTGKHKKVRRIEFDDGTVFEA